MANVCHRYFPIQHETQVLRSSADVTSEPAPGSSDFNDLHNERNAGRFQDGLEQADVILGSSTTTASAVGDDAGPAPLP